MRRLNWRRVLGMVLLASVVLGGCARSPQTEPSTPRSGTGDGASRPASPATAPARAPVAIPSASRSDSPATPALEMSGRVTFPRTERLFFEVAGMAEKVVVQEGDTVRAGDPVAALDSSTVISLQKQAAVARVALDEAEKALKDERERYIPGDVQALQARLAQLQKDSYVLRQTLDTGRETYRKKVEEKLGVPVPPALLERPPDQLADALVAQLGIEAVWGPFQDYVRRLLEGPWEQLNQLSADLAPLQQTLRGQDQALEDFAKSATLTKARAQVELAQGKVETARLERAAALLKRKTSMLDRGAAAAKRNTVLIEYRDRVGDLLGLTVDREAGNGFYTHSPVGLDGPRTVLEKRMEEHVQAVLGWPLQPESLRDADPESLVKALLGSQEGRDHMVDFFLRQKAAASWLALQQARQQVSTLSAARTQASVAFQQKRTADPALFEAAWTALQVAERQFNDANQVRDAARFAYKQLFQDYLNTDLDQLSGIIWEEEPPERLLKWLLSPQRPAVPLGERLRRELSEALQTTWTKVHKADSDWQDADLSVQKADVSILQADIALRDAEESVRQAGNTVEDIDSRATLARLEAQRQATLSRLRQVQDQIKDAETKYKNGVQDYLGVRLPGSRVDQPPDALLKSVKPADTTGFRRFQRDIVISAQEIWGQIQRTLEDTGKAERAVKKAREDLAEAQRGPDPLVVARREQEIVVARKNLEDLERKLAAATIRAPFNGVIRRVALDRGDPVQAYQTVAEIVDLTAVEVEVTADELDLARLAPGTAVQVALEALPGKPFPGKLVSVNPVPKTSGTALQYQAKVRVENTPAISLYEGMSARVRVESPQSPGKAVR
ncbi:MAG: efflux RND transporter periplasmic adaptor subunit [Chloroflexi bacterium]|nr:efflux RND transporter periplasmic adaptor subunit [Chloroflexota bacterium]